MRRLLSATVGAVCLANCEGLPRIYDKTNPIFFISPSGAGAGSWRGGEEGRRQNRPGAENLNLIRNTLKYIVHKSQTHPFQEHVKILCVYLI